MTADTGPLFLPLAETKASATSLLGNSQQRMRHSEASQHESDLSRSREVSMVATTSSCSLPLSPEKSLTEEEAVMHCVRHPGCDVSNR